MNAAVISTYDTEFRSRLVIGLAVSIIAHLALGVAMIGRTGGSRDLSFLTAALPQPEDPLIRPGIARSQAVTINWLGFETPTPHEATLAEIDQAALSPDAPGIPDVVAAEQAPAPDPAAENAPPAPAEAPESPTEIALDEPAPASPAEDAAPNAAATAEPTLPVAVEEGAGFIAGQLVQIVKRTIEGAAEVQEAAAAAAERAAEAEQAREAAQPSHGSSAPAGEVRDAVPSEKESPATSREEPVRWMPGQPVAAEGLDITTVKPRWHVSTRVSALPRNPVVRIDFGRDGRVKRAEFVPGKSTGYRDVDGPLLDALYRWTASGVALEGLPADDPAAVVSLPVEIVLVVSRRPIQRSSTDR